MSKFVFTSESVSEGHPDKVCDAISDAIVDDFIAQDPESHVACETLATKGTVVVSGEVRSNGSVDVEKLVKKTLSEIGYNNEEYGMDHENVNVISMLHEQSSEIAQGVDEGTGLHEEQGAGDQGLMFGYATNETEVLMPAPITYSHRLVEQQAFIRKSGKLNWLRPDAKSQVSFVYGDDGKPESISAVVLSTQHDPEISQKDLKEGVMEEIIKPVLPQNWLNKETNFFINPTGKFEVGGPEGDCGVTGRKIIVDTYGGMARHGGGAFSGKDPSKVDRSAAYAARHVAKNVVAAGMASRCEVQLAYAIGVAEPVSVSVDTFGTGRIEEAKIIDLIRDNFELKPAGLINYLKLLRPIYRKTSAYGHFGREVPEFTWEATDKADKLRTQAGL